MSAGSSTNSGTDPPRDGPYGVLAAILVSRKVGLRHTGLVGEVLVAQARLDEWLGGTGKATLPASDWMEVGDRVAAAEDGYRRAWQEVEATDGINVDSLRSLERALRATADVMRGAYEGLVAAYGR